MDTRMDAGTDSEGERWMSYAELAELRGIDKQSAVKLTFRRRWRRQKDNHGTVHVLVPPDWLGPQRPSRDSSNDVPLDVSVPASTDLS